MIENKVITYEDILDSAKTMIRGKFIISNVNILKNKYQISQINNLNFYLKILEKEEQSKQKQS